MWRRPLWCFDYDCSWALAIQPGHFRLAYLDQITSWYGAISASRSGIDVIGPEIDLSAYKIVFAPVAYVMSEKQAARIRSFVQGGGMFVTNFRLGVKTETSQIVRTPLPGLLRDVMGVTVEDYIPIYSAKNGVKFSRGSGRSRLRVRFVDGHSATGGSRGSGFLHGGCTCRPAGDHHEQLRQGQGCVHRWRPG